MTPYQAQQMEQMLGERNQTPESTKYNELVSQDLLKTTPRT